MKSFNKNSNRYSEKQSVTNDLYFESYDDDCLVDYDETDIAMDRKRIKLSASVLAKNMKRRLHNKPQNKEYIIEYSRQGYIKRPGYSLAGGYENNVPISMEVIRSIILTQHCKLASDQVAWFEDGIRWLAQKQCQSSNVFLSTIKRKRYTPIATATTTKSEIQELEELERACEAYFGIPLGLCEDHWASAYLIQQCKKESIFHRKWLKPHKNSNSLRTVLRKLCCCFPLSMPKKKRSTSDHVGYNEKSYPLNL